MSLTQRREIDRMIEEGQPVTQGVIPDLDPVASHYAGLWSTLRSSTPGDHPISLQSIALLVGEDEMHQVRPLIQVMDQAYFGWQRDRREQEQKQRAANAKRPPRGRRR